MIADAERRGELALDVGLVAVHLQVRPARLADGERADDRVRDLLRLALDFDLDLDRYILFHQ